MSNDDSQKRKIAARIGTAMRDAQYALTVASPQRIPNAMTESYMALVALSEYLSPPNGVPKAAAMAKGIAKIWKKIISLQRHGGSGTMSTTQSEIDPADEHNNRERSFHSLFDETRENHEQQLLREKLASVQEERDDIVNRLHTATEEMAALQASLHAQNKASSLSTSELEDLQRENTALRTALREESIRANALVESLRESNELVQKMQQENASMWAMQEQQRIQLEDKDKAMEAAVIAASRPNAAPQQAIDKDDYEALKLQVKLLRDALRESSNNPDAANIKAGKKTLVDIENEHQEQLLALKITLETQYTREFEHKQQIDHLSKVIVDIQNQLQREQRRAEEAERNANDSAGSVEQHYRGQLAALQAALDQQRSEHATEVNALRLELESEQRRAEEAERNANDSAGSVEQHYRGQLAALQAALDRQRKEHRRDSALLRSNCKLAEEKLVVAESKLNSISAQHREDVNGVNEGFAKERSLLERKLAKAVATRDGAKQEVEVLKNAVRGLEEANQALRLAQEEQSGAFAESEAIFQEEKRSLLGDISLLRSRCLSLEQEVACCNELVQEKTATVNKLVNQLTVARPAMTDSSRSCEGKPALVSVGVEESVHFLRDIVETELKRVIRSTVVVDEESERVMNAARDLRSAIDCTGGLAVRVMERQRRLTHLLNIVMAKQNVALRKIQLCILGSVSLRKSDVAVLEACLLLFNDVECALSEVQETETKEPFKTELPVRVEDERDVLLQRALRRAQNRVNESMSSPAAHDNTPRASGLMMTPVKSVGAPTALKPPSEKKSFTSPSQGKRMTPARESSPYSCASAQDHHAKNDFSFVRSDPFDYAVATLSAQERKHDRRQQQQQHQSMPPKRWVTPGKGGASARTGL